MAADGVLIETLWNVKDEKYWYGSPEKVVLIETLWNVKLISTRFPLLIFPY